MTGNEVQGTFILWAVLGGVAGFLVWRFPSRAKYPVQKICGGFVGAELFGVAVFLFFPLPTPWLFGILRFALATVAAITGGFLLPYFDREERPAGPPTAPVDSS